MKLIRFGHKGSENPGMIDKAGVVRDVSTFVTDWSGSPLDADT